MPKRRNPREDAHVALGLMALAQRAHALRLGRGETFEQTAERADLDVRHVQLIEAGTGNPTVATLLRLAKGLEVSMGALFDSPSEADPLGGSNEPRPHVCCECVARYGLPAASARGKEGTMSKRAAEARLDFDAACAERVRSLRLARDWSQAELARRAGLSQSAIQGIESATRSPTLRTLARVATALETTAVGLLVRGARPLGSRSTRAGRR